MCALEMGNNMSILSRATTNETQQKRGHILENDGLPDDKQKGDPGISVSVTDLELMQSLPQEMQHQEKVSHDQRGVDHQLDRKSSQRFGRLFFHLTPPHIIRRRSVWRLRKTASTSKFHCAPNVSS